VNEGRLCALYFGVGHDDVLDGDDVVNVGASRRASLMRSKVPCM